MDICFKPEQARSSMRLICSIGTQLKWEKIQQYENGMVWWTSANCISSFMHFDNYSFLSKSLYFQQCIRQFTAGEKVKFTESPSVVSHHSSRNKSSSQEVWGCPNTCWFANGNVQRWAVFCELGTLVWDLQAADALSRELEGQEWDQECWAWRSAEHSSEPTGWGRRSGFDPTAQGLRLWFFALSMLSSASISIKHT